MFYLEAIARYVSWVRTVNGDFRGNSFCERMKDILVVILEGMCFVIGMKDILMIDLEGSVLHKEDERHFGGDTGGKCLT